MGRLFGAGADSQALRGGSYFNTEDNVRCAYRNRNNPNNRNNNVGFRVVASTPFNGRAPAGTARRASA